MSAMYASWSSDGAVGMRQQVAPEGKYSGVLAVARDVAAKDGIRGFYKVCHGTGQPPGGRCALDTPCTSRHARAAVLPWLGGPWLGGEAHTMCVCVCVCGGEAQLTWRCSQGLAPVMVRAFPANAACFLGYELAAKGLTKLGLE